MEQKNFLKSDIKKYFYSNNSDSTDMLDYEMNEIIEDTFGQDEDVLDELEDFTIDEIYGNPFDDIEEPIWIRLEKPIEFDDYVFEDIVNEEFMSVEEIKLDMIEDSPEETRLMLNYDEAMWANENHDTFNDYELKYFITGLEQLIRYHEDTIMFGKPLGGLKCLCPCICTCSNSLEVQDIEPLRKTRKILTEKQNAKYVSAFKPVVKKTQAPKFRKIKSEYGSFGKPVKLPAFTNAFFRSFKL